MVRFSAGPLGMAVQWFEWEFSRFKELLEEQQRDETTFEGVEKGLGTMI